MDALILDLVAKYNWAAAILSVMAMLWVILPMIINIGKAVAKVTATPKDDLFFEKVEGSKTYKITFKVLAFFKNLKKG